MPINNVFQFRGEPPIPGQWSDVSGETDETETFPPASNPDADLDLCDITLAIEYRDSRNRITMRRITIYRCDTEDTVYRIYAHCHERKKLRSFLSTGIMTVIDVDGVVMHPVAFFRNEIGVDVDPGRFTQADFSATDIEHQPAGQFAKRNFRHEMRLLSTLSRSDGFMHPAELDFILSYVAKGSAELGTPMTDTDKAAIESYLKRLHPTESQINDAYDALWELPLSRRESFLDACHQLIKADGTIKEQELTMFQEFEDEFG